MFVDNNGVAIFQNHRFAFGKKRMAGKNGVHGYYTYNKSKVSLSTTFKFFIGDNGEPIFYIVHNRHGYTFGGLGKHDGKYHYFFGLNEKWAKNINLTNENFGKHRDLLKGFCDSFNEYKNGLMAKSA